jgi:2-keto-4-pentenoate hydratase/2-oxohepta-3-ene-1,7-dioic acid hydratase in catechol pathway
MGKFRLTSFRVHGRNSFGAVTDAGMVDLGGRLGGRYRSALDVIRAGEQGLIDARAASATRFADYRLEEVEFLPPVLQPEKIICVGINYPERAEEYKDAPREKPKYPNLFVRFPGSLVGHGQAVVKPAISDKFDYEGEIVLVIGREGRNVPREKANGLIYGLTLGNEGSVRDWLRHGSLNVTQGKNFDRSGSLGPWIVPADELDPASPLHLMTRVNGQLRQDDWTERLTWNFAWLISYITQFATLTPGDVIFTGTPVGAGGHQTPPQWLKQGDLVEVEVPEIGTLRNPVINEA